MKLAIVPAAFPPGINGVAMTFGILARALGRRGHAVTVYRPWRPDPPPTGLPPEHCRVALPGLPLPAYRWRRLGLPAGRALRQWWRAERPTLVHVATEGPPGASAVSWLRRPVRHGRNGRAGPCGQPEALIRAAVELARDGNRRGRRRLAAPASLPAHSWATIVEIVEAELTAAATSASR